MRQSHRWPRWALVLVPCIVLTCMSSGCDRQPESVTGPAGDVAGVASVTPEGENPIPTGSLPPATVPIQSPLELLRGGGDVATLTPAELLATLASGECVEETKLLHLPENVTPARADILFVIDLTGSMAGELSNVKNNSINIMNAVRALVPDTNFGVVSHMDYPGYFSGCGYGTTYGDASYGDYPYSLDQALTSNTGTVSAALGALALGYGGDGPEDYTRPLWETYNDPNIIWRPGAKRILLEWGDAVPHDCDYPLDCGGAGSSGPDPGRDMTVGTADDLDLATTLQGLSDNNITLIALHSGGQDALWNCYADKTGGAAFHINSDGTIPGGADIADFVASLVQEEIGHVDELTLDVCTPGYEGWLTSVAPASYTDITLDTPQDFSFDIQICVPDSTVDGEYCFSVCAVGDGAEFAHQDVCITVTNNQPPDCSGASPSVSEIWPPNHHMVNVDVLGVTDPDGDDVTISIVGITQDEPINGLGDGDTAPDGGGVGTSTARVRAERAGGGNGRVYEITFVASDGNGGECTNTIQVCMPHDQNPGHECVDDGQVFDSTGGPGPGGKNPPIRVLGQ